jgi:hypothetical protein
MTRAIELAQVFLDHDPRSLIRQALTLCTKTAAIAHREDLG